MSPNWKKRFLKALRELFNGKCAYCESEISLSIVSGEIDNFRPKNGARGFDKDFSRDHYWWLTYEWKNLYYCCPHCNRYKSTWFPVEGSRAPIEMPYFETVSFEKAILLDPCTDKPEEHFIYSRFGEIEYLSDKGRVTIDFLKLNRSELVFSRKQAVDELETQWRSLQALLAISVDNKAALAEFDIVASSVRSIYNDQSKTPYLGIQRHMLRLWEKEADIPALKLSPSEQIQKDFPPLSAIPDIIAEKILEDALNEVRHIYVEKIEVNNFKCFKNLEIDFSNNAGIQFSKAQEVNPEIEPWVLFLGENGVGKSSILKAIVIGLAGKEYIKDLGITGEEILKHGEKSGFIKIHLVGAVQPIEVSFTKSKISTTLFQPMVNFVAYNSVRLLPKKGKLSPEKNEFYGAKAKNLFDYTHTLIDADHWLTNQDDLIFNRAALALKDLMLLDNTDKFEREDNHIVIRRGTEIYKISDLSDGYQSMYALSVDIMATLAREGVTFDLAEGMVLIDEIGTHLHPRWRMEVVERLRQTFPKIRFVVTTHEPLCLRGLLAGETVVLTRDADNNLMALTELPDPSELRVDQLLTSEFFGLNSTVDPKTEKLFDEYYGLLAMDEEARTETQRNRLLDLSEQIPKIKHLGDTLREELIYYVVDELLAKKTRKDGLKLKEELKVEALSRVESLWSLIDNENKQRL